MESLIQNIISQIKESNFAPSFCVMKRTDYLQMTKSSNLVKRMKKAGILKNTFGI